MSDEVNWNSPSVVVKHQDAVAVYLSPSNDLVIRRERTRGEENDAVIVIPRASARRFIEALESLLLPEEI